MPVVYRVEQENGLGPFDYGGFTYAASALAKENGLDFQDRYWFHEKPAFPCPQQDPSLQGAPYGQCGCISESDLFSWFPRWSWLWLAGKNFGVATFEAPQIYRGSNQVIFYRQSSLRTSFQFIHDRMIEEAYNSLERVN